MSTTQNVLVTGGAGYIGSHVAWRLLENGYTPIVVDNLCHGHEWAVKFGPFVQGDIADEDLIRKVCEQYKPIALIHFAAFLDVAESVAQPEKYWDNNLRKASILFKTVADCGVKRIIFSSTAATYGIPDTEDSITEQMPTSPINPYGESKLAAEKFLRTLTDVQSVCLRYFNASGAAPVSVGLGAAHWPVTHLIPRIVLAVSGHVPPISVFGTDYPTPDGSAIRDYIHVTDLADAHVATLRYLQDGGATDVFNLGRGVGYSVRDVIDQVAKSLGQEVPLVYADRRAGDPPRLVANPSKAGEILGWKAKLDLQDIVASVCAWHQSDRYSSYLQEARAKQA